MCTLTISYRNFFFAGLKAQRAAVDFGRIRDVYTAALANIDHPGMREQLQNSIKGLESLKKTYETDMTYLARVETLMDTITQNGVLASD